MKKVFVSIIFIIIVFFITNKIYEYSYHRKISEYKNIETLDVIVSISKERIEYHHLGNDIYSNITYNNDRVNNGDKITINQEKNIFHIDITEFDTISDSNSGKIVFTKKDIIKNKMTQSTEITVYEDGGRRYSDGYAVYKVTITLTPIRFLSPIWVTIIIFLISLYIYAVINHKNSNHSSEAKQPTLNKQQHEIISSQQKSTILCPYYGSKMVLRKGRYGQFYGCSRYPYCKGTRKYIK